MLLENSMGRKLYPFLKICFIVIVLLTFANLIILDIKFLKNDNSKTSINEKTLSFLLKSYLPDKSEETEKLSTVSSLINPLCSEDCLSDLKEATESIKTVQLELSKINDIQSKITKLQADIDNLSKNQSQTSTQVQTSTGNNVKEFFIPFGSGSNKTDDWADLPGIQAYVDSNQYGKIKSVTFEATVKIPTGNQRAYARLYNATDKHPVWFSEVSLEGGTPQLLISEPISLDSGRKLYQVQMKTTLKFEAILEQARLHINIY